MLDKSLISFIVGPIVGILVMQGVIAPADAGPFQHNLEMFLGSGIFIASLLIGSLHHTKIKEQDNEQEKLSPSNPLPVDNSADKQPGGVQ